MNLPDRQQVTPPEGDVEPRDGSEVDLLRVWTMRIREGDRSAFESLFRAVHPGLLRFAMKLVRDQAFAADLVQDAFIRVWEMRASLDAERSVKSLLFTSVRNLALNRIRDSDNRRRLLDRGEVPMPARRETDAQLRENEFRVRLEGWIEELPPRQRQAIRLVRMNGLDHAEAAEVMECSPRTVNNHLVLALRSLREKIGAHAPEFMDR